MMPYSISSSLNENLISAFLPFYRSKKNILNLYECYNMFVHIEFMLEGISKENKLVYMERVVKLCKTHYFKGRYAIFILIVDCTRLLQVDHCTYTYY